MYNKNDIINYNWMPCVADWSLDHSEEFYISNQVSKQCSPPELNEETAPSVAKGDIVFVKTDYLKNGYFQREILPKIQNPFTLVSGISSYTVDDHQPILDNPFVTRWFCTNPPVNHLSHDKIYPLPIGFEEKERPGGDQEFLQRLYKTKFTNKKSKILLPYHNIETNYERKQIVETLQNLPFVEYVPEKLPFKDYMKLLSEYAACFCIEGAGQDVHRHYECAIVDTIPIISCGSNQWVLNSCGIPSIAIRDWLKTDWLKFYDSVLHGKIVSTFESTFWGKSKKVDLTINRFAERITESYDTSSSEWEKKDVYLNLGYDKVSKSEVHEPLVRQLKKMSHIKTVIDVGCGNGRALLSILDHDIKYIGIDSNKYCIEKAKEHFGDDSKFFDLNVETDDLKSLPSGKKEETLVYFDGTLPMFYDPKSVLCKFSGICDYMLFNRTNLFDVLRDEPHRWGGMENHSPRWRLTISYLTESLEDWSWIGMGDGVFYMEKINE